MKDILFIDIPNHILDLCDQKGDKYFSLKDLSDFDYKKISSIGVSIYQTLSAEFLNKYTNLQSIHVLGTSTDNIDKHYCKKHNILITNVTDYCDHETAEWVIWQLFNFFRQKKHSVYEKTLGIIGMGKIGQSLAIKSLGLGIKTLFFSHHLDKFSLAYSVSLQELFSHSDVIVFTTKAYQEFNNTYLFDTLKKNALVINICMGKVFPDKFCDDFLQTRLDVEFLFDKIAAKYNTSQKIKISDFHAYETLDSQKRLIKKFLTNCGLNKQK